MWLIVDTSHNPALPQSQKVLDILTNYRQGDFDLDIVEAPPTETQLRSIIEALNEKDINKVVQGASGIKEAVEKLKENPGSFTRPLVIDWLNGKVEISISYNVLTL